MKILGEKLTRPVPSILKQLIEIKSYIIFIFTLFCGASERSHLFEAPERSVKIRNLRCFPPYSIGTTRVRTALCQTPYLYHFGFLNNRDT